MSTVVAINRGAYVALGVDDRSMLVGKDGTVETADGLVQKLYQRPDGLMVGGGEHILIDTIGRAFEKTRLSGLPDLNAMIARAYRAVRKSHGKKDWFDAAMDRTTIGFSCVMDGLVRLLVYSGTKDRKALCGHIPQDDAFVIAPFGSGEGVDLALQRMLRRYIKPIGGYLEAARHDAALATRTLAEISRHSDVVSPSGYTAAHFADNTILVEPFHVDDFEPAERDVREELEAVFAAA